MGDRKPQPLDADRDSVVEALSGIQTILAVDGYDLEVQGAPPSVDLSVVAGEGCSDCLVPQQLMERMITDRLAAAGIATDFELRYPSSADIP
ncbi:MAG: hypothetical protein AB7T48_04465 [Solirubrobacterales bacterium]